MSRKPVSTSSAKDDISKSLDRALLSGMVAGAFITVNIIAFVVILTQWSWQ